jgi:hypothetical protein
MGTCGAEGSVPTAGVLGPCVVGWGATDWGGVEAAPDGEAVPGAPLAPGTVEAPRGETGVPAGTLAPSAPGERAPPMPTAASPQASAESATRQAARRAPVVAGGQSKRVTLGRPIVVFGPARPRLRGFACRTPYRQAGANP